MVTLQGGRLPRCSGCSSSTFISFTSTIRGTRTNVECGFLRLPVRAILSLSSSVSLSLRNNSTGCRGASRGVSYDFPSFPIVVVSFSCYSPCRTLICSTNPVGFHLAGCAATWTGLGDITGFPRMLLFMRRWIPVRRVAFWRIRFLEEKSPI